MDEIYRPVWERTGAWKKAAASQDTIARVQNPFIGKDAELQFNDQDYLFVKKHQKKLLRKMQKPEAGLYQRNRE